MDIYRVYDNDEAKKRLSKKLRKAKRKLVEEEEEITEAEISKDVTVFIQRIGEYHSAAKLKWIAFTGDLNKTGDSGRQYKVCVSVNV